MKKLKISLVVIVVAAIGAGIFFGLQSITDQKSVKAPVNQFTLKIEKEIEQIKELDDSFCKDCYNKVAFHINEFYKPSPPTYPYGRFGDTQSANDQWKEILETILYSAYSDKFIMQVKKVFSGSDWKYEDLKFIQAENNKLKKSKLLIAGSPVDRGLTDIQTALNKYNEITSFIATCKGFSYSGNSITADRFPITEVQGKISRAASYRNNHLGNEYVNNCTRLHNGLKEIPQILFHAHVRYLDNKIDYWSNMWCNYNSHKDYLGNIYTPLNVEINDFKKSTIYSGINIDGESTRLLNKWSADNQKAYKATYPCGN